MALPFRAPVYRSYFEAVSGLYRQGPTAFYKGNSVRCMHIFLFHKFNTELTLLTERHQGDFELLRAIKQTPFAQEFLLSSTIDFFLHPLHVAEARFIMQNRRPNFAVYHSLVPGFFTKTPLREMLRGISLHIPRNACIALSNGALMTL